jgi:oligopeptidase B
MNKIIIRGVILNNIKRELILVLVCLSIFYFNNQVYAKKIKKALVPNIKKYLINCSSNLNKWNQEFVDTKKNEIFDYLKAENDYLKSRFNDSETLQKRIISELYKYLNKQKYEDIYQNGNYFYYIKYAKNKNYPIFCRNKKIIHSKEEVILDVNLFAKGKNYCKVFQQFNRISPDNKYLAFCVDFEGRYNFSAFIKNLETDQILNESLENVSGYMEWTNDSKYLMYGTINKKIQAKDIYLHQVGSDQKNDKLIYHENQDNLMDIVEKTRSKKYIKINSFNNTENTFYLINANNPTNSVIKFADIVSDFMYSIEHIGDKFYILINNHQSQYKVMYTNENNTSRENWKDFIPNKDNIFISEMIGYEKYLLLIEHHELKKKFKLIDLISNKSCFMDFENDENNINIFIDKNSNFYSDQLFFTLESFIIPPSFYSYNLKSKEKKLLYQQPGLNNFKPENYSVENHFAIANDNVKIPITLIFNNKLIKPKENLLVLFGYGSYGNTIEPNFNIYNYCLIDRGFLYAIAHVRGGGFNGPQWHEAGRAMKKKNSFSDFICCADYLVNRGLTSPKKMYAYGGSAGGLVIGAVLNTRPDLFNGVIAEKPCVDALTLLSGNNTFAKNHYKEWGDPNDKVQYDYIKSYSPVENVKRLNYCPILVTTAFEDTTVPFWGPLKWVLKLREMKVSDSPVFLYTLMNTGHSYSVKRYSYAQHVALIYSFYFQLAGIKN